MFPLMIRLPRSCVDARSGFASAVFVPRSLLFKGPPPKPLDVNRMLLRLHVVITSPTNSCLHTPAQHACLCVCLFHFCVCVSVLLMSLWGVYKLHVISR